MDLLDDPVGERRGLYGERVRLDPAGCLEQERAGGCGLFPGGGGSGFLLDRHRLENFDFRRRKQAVAEKQAEEEYESEQEADRQKQDAKAGFRGFRGLIGSEKLADGLAGGGHGLL